MTRPRLLDLFCGAGGCAAGYVRAGFEVHGVDHKPQPRYLLSGATSFTQADALEYLERHGREYDAIHASPPCQAFSIAKNIRNARGDAPDLVGPTRDLLVATDRPWVIENVPGSPLRFPAMVCGTQLGLRVRRHRLFESSILLFSPAKPCNHQPGDVTVFGHMVELCGSGKVVYQSGDGANRRRRKRVSVDFGRAAMGIDWMGRGELSQAIPPAYCEFVGRQLIRVVQA